ncbi:MAG: DUF1343 domain-containing protein [Desulfosarcina sp.]|nr:DUF1343 domain-containing protein [Desulfobacterales bacterium]
MPTVSTGLEQLLRHSHPWIKGQRLGLLCNPASIDHQIIHARDCIRQRFPGQLKALYSPQHGFFAEKQDNMVESDHLTDAVTGLPVYSLYGQTRIPTADMLAPIDVLLIDLQDVGTRVYTFVYTLSYCLEAARDCGRRVLVLDRPNPINGRQLEGNLLKPHWASFVGRYALPMRHGMTIAELARFFNDHFGIGSQLDVVAMRGWRRGMWFRDTGLPWVPPSPNMPTPDTAMVYPGQVVWEGTNLSEGRGTAQPFEMCGAPYLDITKIGAVLHAEELPGVVLRPCIFEPTSGKHARQPCRGFQIHVTDRDRYRPYLTTLKLLQAILRCHPDHFEWKPPPYEYEFEKQPIDLILGDADIRRRIERFENLETLAHEWQEELRAFRHTCEPSLIYTDH